MSNSRLSWTLDWNHGSLELQALGGMLAPVRFALGEGRSLSPMQVAPWGEQNDPALPGLLRRLRGEWPCVPFGRTTVPEGVPSDYARKVPDDNWDHGYASHHMWHLVAQGDSFLHAAIDYPEESPVSRLERRVSVDADSPSLTVLLRIHARKPACLPIALHPTLAMPATGMVLEAPRHEGVFVYPVETEPGISHLQAGARADSLQRIPAIDGPLDLTRLPLPFATEELLQLKDCKGPFILRYPGMHAELALEWDTHVLPDVMLWISNGGRAYPPWNGRHFALGIEPVCGFFDLGRVLVPPQTHPLAGRRGIAITPEAPVCISYSMRARVADC
ncbi:MAG: hypothetical protein H6R07_221 [Proteobacteria bacterium]|nr:hypothetical protein [Pseudomonadota bacterium]